MLAHRVALVDAVGATNGARRRPSVSTARRTLLHVVRLAPPWPARWPLSGVERSARPSRIAALGVAHLPSPSLMTSRRSCAAASKAPALRQHAARTTRWR